MELNNIRARNTAELSSDTSRDTMTSKIHRRKYMFPKEEDAEYTRTKVCVYICMSWDICFVCLQSKIRNISRIMFITGGTISWQHILYHGFPV